MNLSWWGMLTDNSNSPILKFKSIILLFYLWKYVHIPSNLRSHFLLSKHKRPFQKQQRPVWSVLVWAESAGFIQQLRPKQVFCLCVDMYTPSNMLMCNFTTDWLNFTCTQLRNTFFKLHFIYMHIYISSSPMC